MSAISCSVSACPGQMNRSPGWGVRPLGGEGIAKAGVLHDRLGLVRPLARGDGRDQEAVARVVQGRLEQAGEIQLAEFARQRHPSRHGARHRHGVPAARGHGVMAREVFPRPGLRRPSRGIQAMQLASVPDDGEQIAADAVHARAHHRHGDGRRDRRVDGVAASRQHAHGGLVGQRLLGADHVLAQRGHALRYVRESPVQGEGGGHAITPSWRRRGAPFRARTPGPRRRCGRYPWAAGTPAPCRRASTSR
ncbi:Uncharacterised protein [Bordetella pertussis]|nr:Uncharacterised protein [Bordetella pertussis]